MAFDDQEALSPRLCLGLLDDMGALVTEHQIHEIPVARTFLLSLVALSATWLFLITLLGSNYKSVDVREGEGGKNSSQMAPRS